MSKKESLVSFINSSSKQQNEFFYWHGQYCLPLPGTPVLGRNKQERDAIMTHLIENESLRVELGLTVEQFTRVYGRGTDWANLWISSAAAAKASSKGAEWRQEAINRWRKHGHSFKSLRQFCGCIAEREGFPSFNQVYDVMRQARKSGLIT